jgi:hypothetical protein
MTTPIDPQRIAALIDGRLDATAREQLLRELNASPEGREILADAAYLVEHTGQSADAAVVVKPRSFWQQKAQLAIAAGVVLVVFGLASRFRTPGTLATPQELAPPLRSPTAAVSATELWPLTRGGGVVATANRSVGIRVGALVADLEARPVADSTVPLIAHGIASLLESVPGGDLPARLFRDVGPSTTMEARDEMIRRAELVVGESEVRAGAWLEGVRIASANRDSAFLRNVSARHASSVAKLALAWGASADQVGNLSATIERRPIAFTDLLSSSTQVLQTLGK